jgi:hypothetical protein
MDIYFKYISLNYYHFEKIFDKKKVTELLHSLITDNDGITYEFIITTDKELLSVYKKTISLFDFKKICDTEKWHFSDFLHETFGSYLEHNIYEEFLKLTKSDKLISITSEESYTGGLDETVNQEIYSTCFEKWNYNTSFYFYKIPSDSLTLGSIHILQERKMFLKQKGLDWNGKLRNPFKNSRASLTKILNFFEITLADFNVGKTVFDSSYYYRIYNAKLKSRLRFKAKHAFYLSFLKNNEFLIDLEMCIDKNKFGNYYIEFFIKKIVDIDNHRVLCDEVSIFEN